VSQFAELLDKFEANKAAFYKGHLFYDWLILNACILVDHHLAVIEANFMYFFLIGLKVEQCFKELIINCAALKIDI
jgi:hypothetical protein